MAHDLDDKHDMGISRIKSESIIVQTKQDYRPWGISQFPTPKRNMSNFEHEHEHKIAIHITWHVLVSFIWCCQRAAEQVSSHWLAGNTFFFRFSFVFFFFFFVGLQTCLYLLAVSRHARSSRSSLCVGGCDSLCICLVEDSLEHLLLVGVQDFGQVLVKLWLLLLKTYQICQ